MLGAAPSRWWHCCPPADGETALGRGLGPRVTQRGRADGGVKRGQSDSKPGCPLCPSVEASGTAPSGGWIVASASWFFPAAWKSYSPEGVPSPNFQALGLGVLSGPPTLLPQLLTLIYAATPEGSGKLQCHSGDRDLDPHSLGQRQPRPAWPLKVGVFRDHTQAGLSCLGVSSARGPWAPLVSHSFLWGQKGLRSPSGLPTLPTPQLCLPAPGSATPALPLQKPHPLSDRILQKGRNNASMYGTFNTR